MHAVNYVMNNKEVILTLDTGIREVSCSVETGKGNKVRALVNIDLMLHDL